MEKINNNGLNKFSWFLRSKTACLKLLDGKRAPSPNWRHVLTYNLSWTKSFKLQNHTKISYLFQLWIQWYHFCATKKLHLARLIFIWQSRFFFWNLRMITRVINDEESIRHMSVPCLSVLLSKQSTLHKATPTRAREQDRLCHSLILASLVTLHM